MQLKIKGFYAKKQIKLPEKFTNKGVQNYQEYKIAC